MKQVKKGKKRGYRIAVLTGDGIGPEIIRRVDGQGLHLLGEGGRA